MRLRSAPYSWCTILRSNMALPHPKVITMTQTAFSCTRYRDLYICLVYDYLRLCTQSITSSCTLYRRCTFPRMRMAVQHPKESTVTQTALLYTRCNVMYSSLTYIALRVPQTVYINHEVPFHPFQHVYNSKSLHCSTPYQGITLMLKACSYTRCTHLPDIHRLTGTNGCVHQLRGPVVPCIVNVQFRKLAWQYTIPRGSLSH